MSESKAADAKSKPKDTAAAGLAAVLATKTRSHLIDSEGIKVEVAALKAPVGLLFVKQESICLEFLKVRAAVASRCRSLLNAFFCVQIFLPIYQQWKNEKKQFEVVHVSLDAKDCERIAFAVMRARGPYRLTRRVSRACMCSVRQVLSAVAVPAGRAAGRAAGETV